ncbi:Uncharacterised protein [Neisseria gonorrhoeae]|uniref:Uncharacterized protein n=1 Tax=Neisseria gonorrhoeae TaxID=485 RepID=A0A378VYU0_NEIGO|nr:Uncharacterised protein [Neisseria gonorrhoeae]
MRIRHAFGLLRCKNFSPLTKRETTSSGYGNPSLSAQAPHTFPYRLFETSSDKPARGRIVRQQHHACRILVQAVQRRNVFNIQMLQFRVQAQTCEQRFPQKRPPGMTGRKCGLSTTIKCSSICKIFLQTEYAAHPHCWFPDNKTSSYPARTKNVHPTPHHPNRPQNRCSTACANCPLPKRKADAQKMQQRQPVKLLFMRQHQITGFDTVQQRKRIIAFFMRRIVTVFTNFSDGISNIIDKTNISFFLI